MFSFFSFCFHVSFIDEILYIHEEILTSPDGSRGRFCGQQLLQLRWCKVEKLIHYLVVKLSPCNVALVVKAELKCKIQHLSFTFFFLL